MCYVRRNERMFIEEIEDAEQAAVIVSLVQEAAIPANSIGCRSLLFVTVTGSKTLREVGVLPHRMLSLRVLVSVASRPLNEAKKVLTAESHKEC